MIFLTACASSDVKQFGGNLAFANQSGEPISTAVTLALGGIIYGVGSLAENSENVTVSEENKAVRYEEKIEDNSTFVYIPNLIEVKDGSAEHLTKDSISLVDENISK